MSSSSGASYEEQACRWLEAMGFLILDRNWRNRYCEIDIVAQKGQTAHIVEVKYRGSDLYGKGYEYVDAKKRRRLLRAAQAWMQSVDWSGDIQIDVISIDGTEEEVTYIENALETDRLH